MSKFNLSRQARYRWMVFGRCVLAIFIGFLIANLSVPLMAFGFSEHKALATYSGLLLSFIIWLLVILYVFSVKSTVRAWLVSIITFLSMSVLYLWLRG